MKRILNKDGHSIRRPLGFVEQDPVCEGEETGAVGHTQQRQPNGPTWRGEGQHFDKEPHGQGEAKPKGEG